MFENVFDILRVEEILPDSPSVLQRARHVVLAPDDGREGMAFLYGKGRRPTLVRYCHWSESGGRMTNSHHGVDATFVDLSLVTSATRDGDDLVLCGRPGFVRSCDTYHSGYYHLSPCDPFESHHEAEETRQASVRLEGVCEGHEPSPLDIVNQLIMERAKTTTGGGADGGLPTEMTRLDASDELIGELRAWHREHPDAETVEYRKRERRGIRLMTAAGVVGLTVSVVLFIAGMRVVATGGSPVLLNTGFVLALVVCMAAMLMSLPNIGRALVEDRRRAGNERIVEVGTVSVIREGDERYLLVRENPDRLLYEDMTTYTLVRLDGDNLTPAYDRDTHVLTFSGDGIWQARSVRYAVDGIIVPSVDVRGMEAIPSFRIADTFVPSIRTMVRVVKEGQIGYNLQLRSGAGDRGASFVTQ